MWALARAQTYVSFRIVGSCTKVSFLQFKYTCGYMHVYKEVLSVSTRKGTNKNVSLHNMGSYRHVWMMWSVYSCEFMCLYTRSFKVCTGTGRDICDFPCLLFEFIYKVSSIWYMCTVYMYTYVNIHISYHIYTYIYIYIRYMHTFLFMFVYICIRRGARCEGSWGHSNVWDPANMVHIQE